MNKFQIESILDGVTPRKDGSMTLRFVTNEISKADKVTLMEFYQSFGWLLFSANEHQESDIPKELAKRDVGQSPSQRLRNRLFVYYKEKNIGTSINFNFWYEKELEKLGNRYLEAL